MKKAILLLAMLSLFMNVASAQQRGIDYSTYPKIQEFVYKNTPFVFEGLPLKRRNVGVNGRNQLVELIQIRKVYRGELRVGDTVEIWLNNGYGNVGNGPIVPNQDVQLYDNFQNGDGDQRFFFCKFSDDPQTFPASKYRLRYMTEAPASRVVEYLSNNRDSIFMDGFTITKIITFQEFQHEVLDKIEKETIAKQAPVSAPAKNTKRKTKKHKRGLGSTKRLPTVGLELWATNQTASGGYYEYDMMAQAATLTYPNELSFFINFNPFYFCNTASGCNAVSDIASLTLDPAFLGTILVNGQPQPKYGYSIYWEVYQQKIGVKLYVNNYTSSGTNIPYNRPAISTTPQRLMHIKMKLKDPALTCVPNAGTLQIALNSFFTTTPSAAYSAATNQYAITFRNNAALRINSVCAAPVITSFSPSTLRAGRGYTDHYR